MAKIILLLNSYEVLYGGRVFSLFVDAVVVLARVTTTTRSTYIPYLLDCIYDHHRGLHEHLTL